MDEEEDIKLPEEKNSETDSKNIFEEQREMSESKKKSLEEQEKFEFQQVEGIKLRKEEEKKESIRQRIFKYLVIGVVAALLIALYFWLLS